MRISHTLSNHLRTHWLILAFVLTLYQGCQSKRIKQSNNLRNDVVKLFEHHLILKRNVGTSEALKESQPSSTDDDPFLHLNEDLFNQTLRSGDTATFKCKVTGAASTEIVFTWYKDDEIITGDDGDPRINTKARIWGSKLTISDVYTADSGWYRCEASNGERRVESNAYLSVSFNALPDSPAVHIDQDLLKGKCELYSGYACSKVLSGKFIYRESFQKQSQMEEEIQTALGIITATKEISPECQNYASAAFCYFVFPPCRVDENSGRPSESDPKPLRLCQEDCDLLKHDICRKTFFQQTTNPYISEIVNAANCSVLPPTTSSSKSQCTGIGLPSVVNKKHRCYNNTGGDYRGTLSVASSGESCKPWPYRMLFHYIELSGGHNFCRNPDKEMTGPWCFVDSNFKRKELCQVPKCNADSGSGDLIMILVPAVSVPLLLGCLIIVFCVACRKKKENKQADKVSPKSTKSASMKKTQVPELLPSVVNILGELGEGKFGKIFKAQILSNLHYCPNDPVAVKTLIERATAQQAQDFQREIDTFAELQHPNIACLKAIVAHPQLRCMIFEFTISIDLHEYLVMHSPHADFPKPAASVSSHASTVIEHSDFIRMAIQVASGMEYLSSNNFIHRDLAARNILVCGNMDLKICNLGVMRDSYLSCYYRSPQGGQMLPVRWMAPESVKNWQFTTKSPVWSFGVLVWEMFSYGLQPYCGYSNHEVIEMISRRQLLTCPDQCPARVYSLMHECWVVDTQQRPLFKDLHAKLVGWEGSNTTRMTSHLAQGIHRQLTNQMRDGVQFVQYSQPPHQGQMIEGINIPMQKHPQNNYSSSPTSGFLTASPPIGPHTSPASRLYHSPGTNSSANSGGYYPTNQGNFPPPPVNQHLHPNDPRVNIYQQQRQIRGSHSSAPSKGASSTTSSEYNQPLRVTDMTSRSDDVIQNNYSNPPSYHSQQYRPEYPQDSAFHDDRMAQSNDGNQHPQRPPSGMRHDGRLPLSVYHGAEDENGVPPSPGRPKPTPAPKPAAYCNGEEQQRQHRRVVSSSTLLTQDERARALSSSSETRERDNSIGMAKSCDSGLPCEDVDLESEGADSHRPLLPKVSSQSPARGTNPTASAAMQS